MPKRPRVIDLFGGAGGFGLGAEQAGARILVSLDNNPAAFLTSQAAGHRPILVDIREVNKSSQEWALYGGKNFRSGDPQRPPAWQELLGENPQIDLLIGGPPCQPFSSAGKRKGRKDLRDGFPAALDAIELLRPTWIALENVRGFLWKKFKAYREELLERLRKSYAWVDCWLLDAADFGVPQHRRRVFIVAGPEKRQKPKPTHFDPKKFPEELLQLGLFRDRAWRTWGDALGVPGFCFATHPEGAERVTDRRVRELTDRPSPCIGASYTGSAGGHPWTLRACGTTGAGAPRSSDRPSPSITAVGNTYLEREDPFKGWMKAAEGPSPSVRAQRPGGGLRLCTGLKGSDATPDRPAYTLRDGNGTAGYYLEPAPTIVGTDGAGLGSAATRDKWERMTGRRRLEPWECARLQDFPDEYPWQGKKSAQYKQIGNAVPPTLGRVVIQALLPEIVN